MDTIYQLDNELMVDLSEDAQELIQGGDVLQAIYADYELESGAFAAVNGPGGSAVRMSHLDIDSKLLAVGIAT